jgi:putative heme-binding domain-containing protein
VLEPSRVIDEKFRSTEYTLKDGNTVTGQLMRDEAGVLHVRTALLAEQVARITKADVKSSRASAVSPMPAGLLDTLTRDEILDLIAYLEAGPRPR